jgi:general secretion pathway protein H
MSTDRLSRRPRPDTGGFTLVEMLVVLAIVGLVIMIAPPLLRSGEGRDLRATAHAVSADLRLLRDEAIRRDAMTTFAPVETGYILRPSGRVKPLPVGIAMTFEASASRLLPDARDLIDFFPDGSSTGGVLSLARNGSIARVLIRGVDGRVQLHDQR